MDWRPIFFSLLFSADMEKQESVMGRNGPRKREIIKSWWPSNCLLLVSFGLIIIRGKKNGWIVL